MVCWPLSPVVVTCVLVVTLEPPILVMNCVDAELRVLVPTSVDDEVAAPVEVIAGVNDIDVDSSDDEDPGEDVNPEVDVGPAVDVVPLTGREMLNPIEATAVVDDSDVDLPEDADPGEDASPEDDESPEGDVDPGGDVAPTASDPLVVREVLNPAEGIAVVDDTDVDALEDEDAGKLIAPSDDIDPAKEVNPKDDVDPKANDPLAERELLNPVEARAVVDDAGVNS